MEETEINIFYENGFPKENRFEKVKEILDPVFKEYKKKYWKDYQDMLAKGSQKAFFRKISPYILKCELYKALAQLPSIENSVATNATSEQITTTFSDFISLITWLNEFNNFVPTKQIFCAFSGISAMAYTYLLTDGDTDQKAAIQAVDDFLIDMNMDAASQGITNVQMTKFRMQARGSAGHSVRTASKLDDIVDNAKEVMSQSDYSRLLGNIVEQALITPGKKE